MSGDALKLTVYFGERDKANGGYLADALSDIYARHKLRTSVVMRGVKGFGAKHRLRTDRLLTLSEDLPLVSVAVDKPELIDEAAAEVDRLRSEGLVTVERARLWTGGTAPSEPSKLTVYLGRQERVGSTPAFRAVVALLHRRGIAGATVLLGVDGTARGARQRAKFFGANASVPLMVIAVGDGDRIAEVLPELEEMLEDPLVTLERTQICKRDGVNLADPQELPETATKPGPWQKLTIYSGGQSLHEGELQHYAIVRAVRKANAAGATSLRGIWGYHGDHEPHGDRFWQLRPHVPVVTVIVDTPEQIRRWYEIVDRSTDEAGLVTTETVPAVFGGRLAG